MTLFRDSEEFGPTLDAAAEHLGISATAVEKDYWVSEVLRVLARNFAGDFIFKGGTSLSKGYRIVERFSEDIDILVRPGGRGTTNRLMKGHGPGSRRRHRRLGDAVRRIRDGPAPVLRSGLSRHARANGAVPHERPAGDGHTGRPASPRAGCHQLPSRRRPKDAGANLSEFADSIRMPSTPGCCPCGAIVA
jgi:hypothetical protein